MKKVCFVISIIIMMFCMSLVSAADVWPPENPFPGPQGGEYYCWYAFQESTDWIRFYAMKEPMFYSTLYERIEFWGEGESWTYKISAKRWELLDSYTESSKKAVPEQFDQNLVFANRDIMFQDGSGYYYRRTDMPFLAGVNIVLPMNGYKDNSWIYTFWVYAEIDTTTIDIESLEIKVRLDGEPFPEGYYYEVNSNDITYYSYHIVSQLNFHVEIPVGEHTVTVIYKYNGEEIGRDSVNIERLSGFVDSDNDGLDDRTGMSDNSQKPIQYPEYSDVQSGVSGAIQELVSFLGASLQAVGQVGAFMKSVFAFLPREIVFIMSGLITVSVVIGIWKLIRG